MSVQRPNPLKRSSNKSSLGECGRSEQWSRLVLLLSITTRQSIDRESFGVFFFRRLRFFRALVHFWCSLRKTQFQIRRVAAEVHVRVHKSNLCSVWFLLHDLAQVWKCAGTLCTSIMSSCGVRFTTQKWKRRRTEDRGLMIVTCLDGNTVPSDNALGAMTKQKKASFTSRRRTSGFR